MSNSVTKKIMTRRKIATTIYLTKEQQFLLKELSERSKVPIAEYIREGVNLILKKNHRHLPGQLSLMLEEVNYDQKK